MNDTYQLKPIGVIHASEQGAALEVLPLFPLCWRVMMSANAVKQKSRPASRDFH